MQLNKRIRSERGQSVILISMVLLSFIMFFSFAVNTAVLVTAKISVQAAADAAAYAGAATQARQLNAISFLNYDMRRQFKKFTYRYDFLANIATYDFPNQGYSKRYFIDNNTANPQMKNLKVPVVCVPLSGKTATQETCLFLNQANTSNLADNTFQGGGLTTITAVALQNVAAITSMIKDRCSQNSSVNLFAAYMWLFRGDPDQNSMAPMLNSMVQNLDSNDQQYVLGTMNNLLSGLGLYPRNLVTGMRIRTLEKFLNESAKSDLTEETVQSFEQSSSAEKHERTIQAFKSALTNLNNEVMPHESVVMQELQDNLQIKLTDILPSFNVYVQFMQNNQSTTNPTYCNSDVVPIEANYVPAGFKTTLMNVHYAVKVKAKAKLMFLPIKDGIELEAIAGAKPFGSRIGPAITENDFVTSVTPDTPQIYQNPINDCSDAPAVCNIPSVRIAGSTNSISPEYLKALADLSFTPSSSGTGKAFKFPGAIYQAMAPQPYEIGRYNIFPSAPTDTNNYLNFNFIDYAQGPDPQKALIYRFYAPIFEAGQNNIAMEVDKALDRVFPATSVGNNAFGLNPATIRNQLAGQMTAYINTKMAQGSNASENGETQTFAAVEFPFNPPDGSIVNPGPFWLGTAGNANSSWGPDRGTSGTGKVPARFGFSVKFVAMQQLLKKGMPATDDDLENVTH